MNILENQYIIPVFVGNCAEVVDVAKWLQKVTGVKPNIFAESFSISQKMHFNCHRISPFKDEWIKQALLDFTNRFEEYYCPVYFICNDLSRRIAKEFDEIEQAYLVIDKDALFDELG